MSTVVPSQNNEPIAPEVASPSPIGNDLGYEGGSNIPGMPPAPSPAENPARSQGELTERLNRIFNLSGGVGDDHLTPVDREVPDEQPTTEEAPLGEPEPTIEIDGQQVPVSEVLAAYQGLGKPAPVAPQQFGQPQPQQPDANTQIMAEIVRQLGEIKNGAVMRKQPEPEPTPEMKILGELRAKRENGEYIPEEIIQLSEMLVQQNAGLQEQVQYLSQGQRSTESMARLEKMGQYVLHGDQHTPGFGFTQEQGNELAISFMQRYGDSLPTMSDAHMEIGLRRIGTEIARRGGMSQPQIAQQPTGNGQPAQPKSQQEQLREAAQILQRRAREKAASQQAVPGGKPSTPQQVTKPGIPKDRTGLQALIQSRLTGKG